MYIGTRASVVVVAVALSIAVGGASVVWLRPLGEADARAAALTFEDREIPDAEPIVLIEREWGEGSLVLVRTSRSDGVHLSLMFVRDTGRGWTVHRRASERAEPSDVVVGSLLHASAPADAGQPAWTAAFGELGDERIAAIEVVWASGPPTRGEPEAGAYLVVNEGLTSPLEIRYLDEAGEEIARVPVSGA